MKQLFSLFLFVFLCISCKNNIQKPKVNFKKPEMDVDRSYAKPIALNPYSTKQITDWKEYEIVATFFTRFKKISANEVLQNTTELTNTISILKDSLIPKFLDTPSLNARINVLENEALRLKDMSKIPSITAKQTHIQVAKILSVFNSLNEKINTLYSQKRFEEAIEIEGYLLPVDTLKNKPIFTEKTRVTRQNKNIPSKKLLLKNELRKKNKPPEKFLKQHNKNKMLLKQQQ